MRFPEIAGTGSFFPQLATNEQMVAALKPIRPDGSPVSPSWFERHFGIRTRGFDFDFAAGAKRAVEDGGLYDTDLAVRAAEKALRDAGLSGADVSALIHVSVTPDFTLSQNHLNAFIRRLGLPATAQYIHLDLGCAALATAFPLVHGELLRLGGEGHALLVASQCASGWTQNSRILTRYRTSPDPWAWLCPSVFSDAGAAVVFRLGKEGAGRGLLRTYSKVSPEAFILHRRLGGARYPTTLENVEQDTVAMNTRLVGERFEPLMAELYHQLLADWPRHLAPLVGAFDPAKIRFFFLHQANLRKIEAAVQRLELPPERVPSNIQWLGNSSAASTLQLLDDARKTGGASPGDLALFLWVGAGNGVHSGYAVAAL